MASKKLSAIQVDLSHLPKNLQDAVGHDLALSVARNMKITTRPAVVGRLNPGIYGLIMPDDIIQGRIDELLRK